MKTSVLCRRGFSLLEVMIATAILASSAMVLTSLIGLGTKYGNRAEARSRSLNQAQSLLDEFLTRPMIEGNQGEITGELPGVPMHRFRVEITPYELQSVNGTQSESQVGSAKMSKLLRVTVELFEATGGGLDADSEPLCRLTQIIRRPSNAMANTPNTNDALDGSSLPTRMNSNPGGSSR